MPHFFATSTPQTNQHRGGLSLLEEQRKNDSSSEHPKECLAPSTRKTKRYAEE